MKTIQQQILLSLKRIFVNLVYLIKNCSTIDYEKFEKKFLNLVYLNEDCLLADFSELKKCFRISFILLRIS